MTLTAFGRLALAGALLGAVPGAARATAPLLLPPMASFDGEAFEDRLGWAVAIVGDIDGDGVDDFVVAAINSDAGGSNAGQVYVFSGAATSAGLRAEPQVEAMGSYIGEADGAMLGYCLAAAGDVNDDGLADLLIGAPVDDQFGGNAGLAYLVLGRTSGWTMYTPISSVDISFRPEEEGDRAGDALAGAGDVDGDGYDDMLIGAPYNEQNGDNAGKAYLVLGAASGWQHQDLADADASFVGSAEDDWAGGGLAGAGDVDGDGYDDVVIGARGYASGGAAFLYLGDPVVWNWDTPLSAADATFEGEAASDDAGYSVAGVGDVNGDGLDDLLIGAPGSGTAGEAYLVLGRSTGWITSLSNADASFVGEEGGDEAGITVSAAGDMDGDGLDDMVIGARSNDHLHWSAGQAYVVRGRASGWAFNMQLTGADASILGFEDVEEVGESLGGGGDLDGDGFDDIIVGGSDNEDAYTTGGSVYVVRGFPATDVDGDGMVGWIDDCDEEDAGTYLGSPETVDGFDENCNGIIDDGTAVYDDDGDGFTEDGGDCDDGDEYVFPESPEYCDGVDSDCDGSIPAAETTDTDGDGWLECQDCDDTNPSTYPGALESCDGIDSDCTWDLATTEIDDDGDGYSECEGDCDDLDAAVNPAMLEVCNGLDDDCNADTDELVDLDGDGWTLCDGDCIEGNDLANPAAPEVCDGLDNDCDGVVDWLDDDGDGWDGCADDCDDDDPNVHPGATEVPYDDIDQDCDGIDLVDQDEDGFSAAEAGGDDCDDNDPGVHPGAVETPHDGVDQDCDGDDFIDADGDGYEGGPDPEDCDDADSGVHPGAAEDCTDAIDNDCDGMADGQDTDCLASAGDEEETPGCACSAHPRRGPSAVWLALVAALLLGWRRGRVQPRGTVSLLAAALTFVAVGCVDEGEGGEEPATEPCDEVTGYYDGDGDGWGDPALGRSSCNLPPTYSQLAEDCDDTDPAIHPGAIEPCNGIDDDCDGLVDEDSSGLTWYADDDGDGYGDPAQASSPTCEQPSGYVIDASDCDDGDPDRNVGPDEPCDGIDADCDGNGDGDAAAALEGTEYASIQQALDAADSGDTVWICPGTHTEQLQIPPLAEIALGSASASPSDTVLDGLGTNTIVEVADGPRVTLSHLTLQNGKRAVDVASSDLVLDDCLVTANTEVALLISGSGAEVSIVGTTFSDNVAIVYGGAIQISGAGFHEVVIEGSTFVANSADSGGAISVDADASNTLTIVDSLFDSNSALDEGGAIHHSSWGDLHITASTTLFFDNTAGGGNLGGAISLGSHGTASLTFDDTAMIGNRAASGGALALHGWGVAYIYLTDTVLSGNDGTLNDGGAINVGSWIDATIDITGGAVIGSPGGGLKNTSETFVLTSDDVDWGFAETENTTHDVNNDGWIYDHFTTGEVFTCTGDGTCY